MTTTPAEALPTPPVEIPTPPKRSILRDARQEMRDTYRHRHLLRYLVTSALRTENANTVFGFVWWILDPLLLMAVYVVFVGVLLDRGGEDFAVFILTAIIVWELFAKGARNMMSSTVRKEKSMRQIAFPKTVLPLSAMAAATVHFAAAFGVLLVVAIAFGIYPSPIVVLAIPIVAVQLVLTLGLGFFLSATNIFFRDTAKLTRYVFRIGFYLSPTLYPVSAVPERFRDIYMLNPFATLMPAYRDVVMYHKVPDVAGLAIVAGVSLVLLVLGYLFFVRLQPMFAKLV